mgnify:CR=1 FL=1
MELAAAKRPQGSGGTGQHGEYCRRLQNASATPLSTLDDVFNTSCEWQQCMYANRRWHHPLVRAISGLDSMRALFNVGVYATTTGQKYTN